jgi:FKBP-type peptidyl-prolyl cis-trans isomerase
MARRSGSGTPNWLKYATLAFIAYAGYIAYVDNEATVENGQPTASNTTTSPLTAVNRSAGLTPERLAGNLVIQGEVEGIGDEAACGQIAQVSVSPILPNNLDSETIRTEVAVGVNQQSAPWAAALKGMRAKGIRQVSIPASQVYTENELQELQLSARDLIKYNIELITLSPSLTPGTMPMMTSDVTIGQGAFIRCGTTLTFHLKLWGPTGELMYTSHNKEPLIATAGAAQYMYGLDRMLIDMRVGSIRRAVIPPEYLQATNRAGPPVEANTGQGKLADMIGNDHIAVAEVTVLGLTSQEQVNAE